MANSSKLRRLSRSVRRSLVEAMEPRVMFAVQTDYVLDGNTLTTYTNGVAGAPVVVGPNVTITGDATANHVIVQNFAGNVTITGNGGGDSIQINAGGGGTYTVSGGTSADQLVVRAPGAVAANVTVGASTVSVGSETVSYPAGLGAISVVGQLFTSGDTLTVVGTGGNDTIGVTASTVNFATRPLLYYSTFTQLTVTGGGGNDTFTQTANSIPTTLSANGVGDASFTVNGNSAGLTISGSTSGTCAVVVNGNSGPLTVNGQGAANTVSVNASAASVTINGGSSTNVVNVAANGANLVVNGGGTANTVNVAANAGTITVNGGTGADAFNVVTNGGAITLRSGAGATTAVDVAAPTVGGVTVTGNAVGTSALTFHGRTLADNFAVTGTSVSAGTGASVNYSNLASLTVDGVAGNDTFLVSGVGTALTLLGQSGNNTFNVRSNTGLTTIDSGTGTNTINVGSNVPGTSGNVLSTVAGGVALVGSGTDVLNLQNGGDATARQVTLSATGFTGIGGGITYAGVATLNVKMGSGNDELDVTGTAAGTTTGVDLGAGTNKVVISSSAPAAGGNVDGVLGTLNLTGAGADDLIVDDSGSAVAKTGTLGTASLTGLSGGTVNFGGFDTVQLSLGTAGNSLFVTDVLASVSATVTGGSGADGIVLEDNHGAVVVNTQGAGTGVALLATHAGVTVNSGGSALVVIASAPPAMGGMLSTIQGPVVVNGAGSDALVLDDTGNASNATGTVSDTQVTGFGMVAGGVTYSNVASLDVDLGTGASNAVTVTNTAAGTTTTITGNTGSDVVTVVNTGGVTNVNTAAGDDAVNVVGVGAQFFVDLGTGGTETVRVSSDVTGVAGNGQVDGVLSDVHVTAASSAAALVVDDRGNAVGKTVFVSNGAVAGASFGTVVYSNMAAVSVMLGTGGDFAVVTSTSAVTTVDTGGGDDGVNVTGTSNPLTVLTGDGDDLVQVRGTGDVVGVNVGDGDNRVVVGSNGIAGGGVLAGIGGRVTVTGGTDATELDVDDWGNGPGTVGEMTPTQVSGLSTGGIEYHGVTKLVVSLGTANDDFAVHDTIGGVTILNTNAGADQVNVERTSGDTTIANDAGLDVVSVGDPNVVSGKGVMDGIAGALHLTANLGASYTLNLVDNGTTADKTESVSAGLAHGFSPADVDFAGVGTLDVALGDGNNTLVLASPAASSDTNVWTGAGQNTINVRSLDSAAVLNLGPAANVVNVGSNAPSGGSTLDLINGQLTVHGGGHDEVNLLDGGNGVGKTVAIDAGDVTGATPVAVLFDNVQTLRVTLGGGDDAVTVNDSTAFLTVNTAGGDDEVTVRRTTRDITVVDTSGTNSFWVGSVANKMDSIVGNVGVTGNGASTLVVDDSGDSTGRTVGLTANHLTGLSAADVSYTTMGTLDVRMGAGNDVVNVSATGATVSTLLTLGAGADVVNVGSGTGVNPIVYPMTVTGSGNDTLNVSDAGASGARAGTLTASVLTLAGAVVNYSGLSNVNLTLVGEAAFGVLSTLGSVTTAIVAGGGAAGGLNTGGTVTVGGAGAGNLTGGVVGAVSIDGGQTTQVVIDDSADVVGRTVVVNPTSVSGLTGQPVTYTNAWGLDVRLGSGADTLTVNGTHATASVFRLGGGNDSAALRATTGSPTTIYGGAGTNSVVLGSSAPGTSGGITANLHGPVNVDGTGGVTNVVVDDSGGLAGRTVLVSGSAGGYGVQGMNPNYMNFSGVAALTLQLGSQNDEVSISGSGPLLNVDTGAGNDAVSVTGGALAGPVVLFGGAGPDSLVVDDSASAGTGNVTVSAAQIAGMGGPISYAGFATLSLTLGAGEGLVASDLSGQTATTVSVPSGRGNVSFAGPFVGALTLSTFGGGSVNVAGVMAGTLSVAGNLGTLSVGQGMSGTLSVGGNAATVSVGGTLSGSVSVGGNADNVTVGGNLAGPFVAGGKVGRLTIGGMQSGGITVGAVDLIGIGGAVPAVGTGAMLTVKEAGVVRVVRAIASEGVAAGGVSARIAYDSAGASVPQAAVELSNADAANKFDLILEAPAASGGFNLTRVESADGREVGVRNVNVVGDLFNQGLTAAQTAYLGGPGTGGGGVYLPSDDLAAVAVTGNMALWSVRGRSLQAVGFSSVTYKKGVVWSEAAVEGMKTWQADILLGTLALNPQTKLPATKLVTPTQTLRAFAGLSGAKPVGLFRPTEKFKKFVSFPVHLVDQRVNDGEAPVAAELTYQRAWQAGLPVITNLTLRGTGGSVDTQHIVKNVTSTGALGDVNLRAGKAEVLQSLNAPSMFGRLNLFGGTMGKAAKKGFDKAKHLVSRK